MTCTEKTRLGRTDTLPSSMRYVFAFLTTLVAAYLCMQMIWGYLFISVIVPTAEYINGGCTSGDFWATILRNGTFAIGGCALLLALGTRVIDLIKGQKGEYHISLIALAFLMFGMSWYHTTLFPITAGIDPATLAKEYLVLAHWDFRVSTPARTCSNLGWSFDPIHAINSNFFVVAVYLTLLFPVMHTICRSSDGTEDAKRMQTRI